MSKEADEKRPLDSSAVRPPRKRRPEDQTLDHKVRKPHARTFTNHKVAGSSSRAPTPIFTSLSAELYTDPYAPLPPKDDRLVGTKWRGRRLYLCVALLIVAIIVTVVCATIAVHAHSDRGPIVSPRKPSQLSQVDLITNLVDH